VANSNPKPPNAGKGRPKGIPNKVTGEVKGMILGALSEVGGQAYLVKQAYENPVAFMTLVGKVLPLTLGGDPDAPIAHEVRWTIVDPSSRA
jgi:hypothetical protein